MLVWTVYVFSSVIAEFWVVSQTLLAQMYNTQNPQIMLDSSYKHY